MRNFLKITAKVMNIGSVYGVIFCLETEYTQRNIIHVLLVKRVQKGFKTFNVIQALRILSGFKNTS